MPLLVLYSQVLPASKPVTLTVPILVMPSLELAPVSCAKAMLGAAGTTVSTVMLWVAIMLVLPAASVWITEIVLSPSPEPPKSTAIVHAPSTTMVERSVPTI